MKNSVNLFWTGGWDSTYRLLELLSVHHKTVQPYYILDSNRRSTPLEIQAMGKIKEQLFKKFPETRQLLLPVITKKVEEIKPNAEITEKYKRLFSLKRLGGQYEWLARFAEEEAINELELCVYTPSPSFFHTYVRPCLTEINEGSSINYRLVDNPSHPDLSIFKYYRFPNHELSKKETQILAKKYNFADILEQTWFCHKPINNKPCGLCMPCRITIDQGLGRRLPVASQVKCFIQFRIKPPIKRALKVENKNFNMIPWFSN